MPSPSKRIQVLLRQPVMEVMETFAPEQGLTWSKAAALLIEEALKARGLLDAPSSAVSEALAKKPEWVTQGISNLPKEAAFEFGLTEARLAAVEATEAPNLHDAVVALPAEKQKEALEKTASTDAQMLKLKLMQELMDQLKVM